MRILVTAQNKEHQLEPSHVSSLLSLVTRGCLSICLFTCFRRWQCSVSGPVLCLWVIKIYSLPLLSHSECLEELPLDVQLFCWEARLSVINTRHSWCSTPRLSLTLHSDPPWHFCCDYTPPAFPDYGELPPALAHLTGLQSLLGDSGSLCTPFACPCHLHLHSHFKCRREKLSLERSRATQSENLRCPGQGKLQAVALLKKPNTEMSWDVVEHNQWARWKVSTKNSGISSLGVFCFFLWHYWVNCATKCFLLFVVLFVTAFIFKTKIQSFSLAFCFGLSLITLATWWFPAFLPQFMCYKQYDFPAVCIRVGDSWDFWYVALFLSSTVMLCPVSWHSISLSRSYSAGGPLGRHKRREELWMRQSYFPISPFSECKLFAIMVCHSYCWVQSLLGEEHSATLDVQLLLKKKKKSLNVFRAATTNPNGSSSGLGSG